VEYRYTMDLKDRRVFSSHWILNSNLFTRTARFSLKPYVSTYVPVKLRWSWQGLAPGISPKEGPDRIIRMEVANFPAFQEEDFMPPPNEVKSRVDFIYESEYRETDPDPYWQHVGKKQNEIVEHFIDKRKAMEQAVAQIVSPSDSPEVKLRKIYGRAQQIRNTSYEILKTAQEEKRDKTKPDENVEDVWKRGYGTHRQITWLFLAMARAAGFEAYPVLASSRRDYFFSAKTMEYWKLNAGVVLVKLNGKDLYFDPGAEFNAYGVLTWSETGVTGLRLDKDGGTWVTTTLPESAESLVQHTAKLKLTENGGLEGRVTLNYTGLEAMYHRLDVRNADDVARKKFLETRIKNQIPVAAEAELITKPDWTNSETPLVAELDVKIPEWASNAGKRIIIPAGLFTAGEKHVFEHASRVYPIYHRYPYEKEDDVSIELPDGWRVSSVPPAQTRDGHVITYKLTVENNKTTLHLVRKFSVNFLLLGPEYYGSLREFYQFVRTGDDQQIVLEPVAAAASN
jgi:Transglutaminase-like superfamily